MTNQTLGTHALSVENLTVRREKRLVLQNLNITVARGSVTGLLGPSGSGKSTLIRSIVGVQKIESGTVKVLGKPAGSAQLRRSVGYVTQSPSVYSDLSVRTNVAYFAQLLGKGDSAVEEAISAVDLESHADDRVDKLSGGQRSRVSLACAIVGDPELYVLDEPTVGLDPVLRRDLWNLFHRLAQEGKTLLVSSHVMDEASRCDQLILLRDGRIVANETLDSLLQRTNTRDAETAFLALIDDANEDSNDDANVSETNVSEAGVNE